MPPACAPRACRCCHTGCGPRSKGRHRMGDDRLSPQARADKLGAAEADGIVRCDACPVLCRIRPGRSGACARYANDQGRLVRTDPLVLIERTVRQNGKLVAFAGSAWDGAPLDPARTFLTGIAARTPSPASTP